MSQKNIHNYPDSTEPGRAWARHSTLLLPQVQVATVVVAFALYALAFPTLNNFMGPAVVTLAFLPVVLAGWFQGLRGGLLAGMLSFPLNVLLLNITGEVGWTELTGTTGGAAGSVLLILAGGIVGRMRDLRRQVERELTERKQAEDTLRENEKQLSSIYDTVGDVIFYLSVEEEEQYRFISANPAFYRVTGLPKKAVIGMRVDDVIPKSSLKTVLKKFRQAIEEKVIVRWEETSDYPNRTVTGEVSVAPVFDDKGQCCIHLVGSIHDITERKKAEEEIQELNLNLEQRVIQRTQQLEQVNKDLELAKSAANAANVSKSEFLASMSHELRTPLSGVLGLSEALQKGVYGAVNKKQISILQTIEEGGRHLLNLINDILDLSKIEAGKMDLQPSIISVDEVCKSSLRMVKQIAHLQHQNITFTQNPPDMMMYADSRRIKQILVNLLGNAVKFTPENGELGLEVTGDVALDVIWFSVWDQGIGITQENLEKLFQPFVQLDSSLSRSYTGTGLGLSLVQRLALLHGGNVKVASTMGEGSRFTVSIPWYKDEATALNEAAAHISEQKAKDMEEKGKPATLSTILVIEDNDVIRAMISDFLSFQGYHAITAQSGQQGMDTIVEDQPDLVLMDIQMPGMDGLEAIRAIRKMPGAIATIPIIAFTALAMPEDRQRCLDAGANDYLSKPVDLGELHATIKRVIETKK